MNKAYTEHAVGYTGMMSQVCEGGAICGRGHPETMAFNSGLRL